MSITLKRLPGEMEQELIILKCLVTSFPASFANNSNRSTPTAWPRASGMETSEAVRQIKKSKAINDKIFIKDS